MTKDNDLLKRLRLKRERCHDLSGVYYTEDADCQAAADRIEELEAELASGSFYKESDIDKMQESIKALTEQLEDARLDAKEAEAYSVWLEKQLAKAVKALDRISGKAPYADDPYDIARAALAELKGHKP
jgi:uncharacterized coiled-coil protein SlyX